MTHRARIMTAAIRGMQGLQSIVGRDCRARAVRRENPAAGWGSCHPEVLRRISHRTTENADASEYLSMTLLVTGACTERRRTRMLGRELRRAVSTAPLR